MSKLPVLPQIQASTSFLTKLRNEDLDLSRTPLEILQVNVGKYCNQACLHCHVEAGPKRTEKMSQETAEQIISLLKSSDTIHTLDITGGAPELHPTFRYFIKEARALGKTILDRCNLTVFFVEGQEDLLDFLVENEVQVIASLPCYSKKNVDKQRGSGTFKESIDALQLLNKAGYAKAGSNLKLDLVYNPLGASLPPNQAKLEAKYKEELMELFGIEFNSLYTITNMPIKRFHYQLMKEKKLDDYMQLLLENFNPHAAKNVMCRNLISISWDGYIYDCDFNQMLDMPTGWNKKSVFDINSFSEINEEIVFADHCYACTAGAGSSCGGSLV